jgi:sec-independent protein translocase protein TatA
MFENLGGAELMLIFLVILIFFGPKKIPELATQFGKGLRKFRDAKEGFETQVKTAMREPLEAMQEAKAGFDKHFGEAHSGFKDQMQAAMNAPLADSKEDFNKQIADTQAALADTPPPPMPVRPYIPVPEVHEQKVQGGAIIHKLG